MIYTVTCNPAIDYTVRLDDPLCRGTINRNAEESMQFGGKGINVSAVLTALGQKTVALGFIAGFTGEGLENGLRSQGIPTDFIPVKEGFTRINVKVKEDRETEINGIGPKITEEDMEQLYEKLSHLQPDDVLVLSGSLPGCLGSDTYEKILSRVREPGVLTVVDATGELLRKCLPYKPFLIKPNRQELEALFEKPLNTEEQLLESGEALQQLGARNVLISLAGDGAVLLDENGKIHRMGCPRGSVVNSVGAGDSMVAGFLAGYLETGDYDYALKLGTAAGSATAFSVGMADKDAIMNLLRQL